jgi:U32 family peptidase
LTPPKKTQTPHQKPELLAPAGTIETFFAALEQGADAVYVGTPRFNARLRARNFSMDELARMVAYAHRIGRQVFVALNTLVKETELPALVETLDDLRRIGPDALIVQDLGVVHLARRLTPDIPLHASTQMTIHNVDGALQAQRMGFARAILAREMTLDEIAAVRRGCQIELETFVHGAMCYSISGACNFSSYAHGTSANRGRCLQPCRRVYDAGEERLPLFAPLDLSAAPILSRLIAAGIRCFKIEGRLKPAETIAQIVAAYRLLIDAHPAITKEVVAEARDRLKLAIGRKQSTGFYLSPAPGDSMVGDGMSRSGRYLGKALHATETSFDLQTREVVKVGDRLNVQKSRHDPPRGFKVKRLCLGTKPITRSRPNQTITITAPFEVDTGAAVVKLIDADAVTDEARRHEDKKWPKARARAKTAFPATFRYDANGAVVLETEANGHPVAVEEWPSFETYLAADAALGVLNASARDFSVRLEVEDCGDFPDGVPMTEPELTALRDKALGAVSGVLDDTRDAVLAGLQRPSDTAQPAEAGRQAHRLVRVATLQQAQALVRRDNVSVIMPVSEAAQQAFAAMCGEPRFKEGLILELPTFAFDHGKPRDALLSTLKQAIQAGIRRFFVSNLSHFNMLWPYRKRGLQIVAGEALHCMNSACLDELRGLGASQAVLAQESDRDALRALVERVDGGSVILTVYGKVPLFRSRQPHPSDVKEAGCVVGSREQLQILRRDGLTWVVPERDFSLRHRLAELREMGVGAFLYDLTYMQAAPKQLHSALSDTRALDPESESEMNFERGVE